MIEPRSWTSGSPTEFAITLSFAPDPDRGCGAARRMWTTWGSFEIWVNGMNLCLHREEGVTLPAVHWYLYPVLRWFVTNWDVLLHEERLPNRNVGRDAWRSLRSTADTLLALSEPDAEAWDASQHAWWMRHALPACRQGGLFPDIVIRRMQDSIEFSWGPSSRAGTPPHFYFLANHGYARIDPRIVAKSFSDVIGPAIEHLCSEASDEPAFSELRAAFQTLSNVDRLDQQLALICGLHSGTRDILRVRSDFQSNRLTSFTTEKRSRLVVEDAPQFCLMFGSVAPDIDEQDVEQLIGLVASICHPYQENELLRKLVCDAPIRSALERPWDRGYALAEDLHQALEGRYRDGSLVDVEALVADLGIAITSIELNDKTIRAIAIAGEECRPTVAINTRYKYQHSHPRRFTLAHELCHILHDRTHGVRLALASGPWAPVDVEKRANAFAAMFLMPPELIRAVIEQDQIDLESVQGLRAASKRLEVSFSALIEHVCNLGFIDEATHDELKQQDIQNSAPKMLP